MKIADRVDLLEAKFIKHIEESGAIRADLAWLKKAFWTLTVAVITATVTHFIVPGDSHVRANMPQVPEITLNR